MTAGDVTSVRVVRVLRASPEAVFDAWLDPDAIRLWMCPGEIFESLATIDARVGGRFRIVMRSPGLDDVHSGEYRELHRPRRLAFTWTSAGTRGRQTYVAIDLRPVEGAGCELTLVHSELPPEALEQHATGWRAHLRELIGHLEGARTGEASRG